MSSPRFFRSAILLPRAAHELVLHLQRLSVDGLGADEHFVNETAVSTVVPHRSLCPSVVDRALDVAVVQLLHQVLHTTALDGVAHRHQLCSLLNRVKLEFTDTRYLVEQ